VNYSKHTDEELIRHADMAFNPMVTTDLEIELLARLENSLSEGRIQAGMLDVLVDEFDLDTALTEDIEQVRKALQFAADYDLDTVRTLMDAALAHDIDTAAALKPRLELADQIEDARNDCAGALETLTKIFNPAPETT
jgi:hypothetical protein